MAKPKNGRAKRKQAEQRVQQQEEREQLKKKKQRKGKTWNIAFMALLLFFVLGAFAAQSYVSHKSSAVSTTIANSGHAFAAAEPVSFQSIGAVPDSSGSVSTTSSEFLFNGQQQDETGLYYLRARYYDPKVGRFISSDPEIGHDDDPATLHRYTYASNDPVNRVDPTGRADYLSSITAISGIATLASTQLPALQTAEMHSAEIIQGAESYAPEIEALAPAVESSAPAIEAAAPEVEAAVGNSLSGAFEQTSESMSERAAQYQERITGLARGMVYRLNDVKFDGFKDGKLLDAKGPGYATFVRPNGEFYPWFRGAQGLVDEAERQTLAAGGQEIEWHVAEQKAATAMQELLAVHGYGQINVIYTP